MFSVIAGTSTSAATPNPERTDGSQNPVTTPPPIIALGPMNGARGLAPSVLPVIGLLSIIIIILL